MFWSAGASMIGARLGSARSRARDPRRSGAAAAAVQEAGEERCLTDGDASAVHCAALAPFPLAPTPPSRWGFRVTLRAESGRNRRCSGGGACGRGRRRREGICLRVSSTRVHVRLEPSMFQSGGCSWLQ